MTTAVSEPLPPDIAVLTVEEMYAADRAAMAAGIRSLALMHAAGAVVTATITARWSRQPVTVLCGPGNNGGDGYVIARMLRDAGWPVQVAAVAGRVTGDAEVNAQRWQASGGAVAPFGPAALDGACLIVDALFGAGLRRPLTPEVRAVIDRINRSGVPCVAVDIPSGVLGDSGEVLGGGDDGAPVCAATVTFFRPKPGHLLYPGRALCGALTVADIGIPARVLTQIKPATVQNTPLLWRLPRPGWGDHKYTRGHGVIFGGARMTGAARLAARAARRVGAGLVTLAVPDSAVPVYAGAELGALVERRAEGALGGTLADPRRNGVLIGPGAGIGSETRGLVAEILESGLPVVLDADALTSYADRPDDLFGRISGRDGATVLTPHGGEFQRLFPDLGQGGKLTRARAAAARAGATVVLKGADTVVAMPDGRAAIATNAPPWLATGGTGDVLAGLILGLLVQGTDAWTAATAGVWLQGAAAGAVGRGLIAEDLPDVLPRVLNAL